MRFFAITSWKTILLISAGWLGVCVLADSIARWLIIRSVMKSSQESGAVTFLAVGVTPRGVMINIVPPLVLLALKLIAARASRR